MPSPISNSPNSFLLLHRHSDSPHRPLTYSTPSNLTSATLDSLLPCPVHKTVIPHRDQVLHSFLQDTTCLPSTSCWPHSHQLLPWHCVNKKWPQQPHAYTCLLLLSGEWLCRPLQRQSITHTVNTWHYQVKQVPSQPMPTNYIILRHLIRHLKSDQNLRKPDHAMLPAVFCLAFHGLLQVSEYTAPSDKAFSHNYMQLSVIFSGIPSTLHSS